EFLFTSLESSMADEEFNDPMRKQLLNSQKQSAGLTAVPPTIWALLWLADLSSIEKWLNSSRTDVIPATRIALRVFEDDTSRVISKCADNRVPESTNTSS